MQLPIQESALIYLFLQDDKEAAIDSGRANASVDNTSGTTRGSVPHDDTVDSTLLKVHCI